MTEEKKTEIKKRAPETPVEIFKAELATKYLKQINNSLGESAGLKFLGTCVHLVESIPALLSVERASLINSIMQGLELGLSIGPSGEYYVIPYAGKAQGQIGYKGIVKLLYGAGVSSIRSEIVYKNDKFSYTNGVIHHEIDIMKSTADRGAPIGCYVVARYRGDEVSKAMNIDDIMKFKEFSKSKGSKSTPWKQKNDPELNMWKKTVLKQLAKMLPQSESLVRAMEIDNNDSIVGNSRGLSAPDKTDITDALEGFSKD